ncbi:hypothetical protein GQ55_5G226200 [Panicum hallii var. hallii]|jgi:hypothetical protein|uniref:4Fe-4S ferredoxin-type domain-containing protein n=2 Tax=Panicum hallii TaxID=206008 RepID=A0A2T7DJ54_9POAL|nr:vegetative cell wall protein gp1-like [Panicum hallii]PUZ55612.1 hypothetical protein GQ55_5G226200 [Panicum hallii var. hallii]PVH38317.1 hypothetical protein PAHAL_5G227900 [Panicum hallii]
MGRPVAPVLALAIVALASAVATAAAAAQAEVKCGGCSPCGGADCPVLYPSPPPPPPYYYYSPPPPAAYPGSGCPPPPGAYIQIGSTPPGKGPLYPQDPGFMPSAAPGRAAPLAAGVLAAVATVWAAFL